MKREELLGKHVEQLLHEVNKAINKMTDYVSTEDLELLVQVHA